MDAIGPMPYRRSTAARRGLSKGALNYWKANFLATLNDEAIDVLIDSYARVPVADERDVPRALPRRGHARRVTATAFPHRSPGYNLSSWASGWTRPTTDDNIQWVRDTYAA